MESRSISIQAVFAKRQSTHVAAASTIIASEIASSAAVVVMFAILVSISVCVFLVVMHHVADQHTTQETTTEAECCAAHGSHTASAHPAHTASSEAALLWCHLLWLLVHGLLGVSAAERRLSSVGRLAVPLLWVVALLRWPSVTGLVLLRVSSSSRLHMRWHPPTITTAWWA